MSLERANYLARHLLARAQSLDATLRDDDVTPTERHQRQTDLVAKILAIDAGITDNRTVQLVAGFLPNFSQGDRASERDRQALAELLRPRLQL